MSSSIQKQKKKTVKFTYWKRPYQNWSVEGWDQFYFDQPSSRNTFRSSRNSLNDELTALMDDYGPNSNEYKKALSLSRKIKGQISSSHVNILGKRPYNNDNDEMLSIRYDFSGMKEYCDILLERQESQIEEVSRSGRHLFQLLKWSIIDSELFRIALLMPNCSRPAISLCQVDKAAAFSLKPLIYEGKIGNTDSIYESLKRFVGLQKDYIIDSYVASSAIKSVLSYCPAPSLGLESGPSESHSKIQLWNRILSDAFIYNLVRFEPVWEYHQFVPGHGGRGSSYCDFVAAVIDERRQLFPFFIIEFERHDREIHKDHAVVAAEAAFELNRLLSIVPESNVLEVRVHVGLVSNSNISLGVLRPFYNDDGTAILFAYDRDVATFRLQNDTDKLLDAFKLLVYLREVVCKDGLITKNLVDNSPGICDNVVRILPKLPTRMEKSRESSTYTPKVNIFEFKNERSRHWCFNRDILR
ncbi:44119_t:CDS:2 [Gigaspora margarita]|uniref:44119_t:CDS:1 n=1 Tax=Gigaspora margarita TaxID=4874 RepID=A0ABN7VE17_GIGMA|nr:44119_t:CDS:2 [Gigaspora margarita]